MAIPSGPGTEVLHRGTVKDEQTQTTFLKWDGSAQTTVGTTNYVPQHHIVTLLNISFCNKGTASNTLTMMFYNGTNSIRLIKQDIGGGQTFVWNDRIVLHYNDSIQLYGSVSEDTDIVYNYIDQDWTT